MTTPYIVTNTNLEAPPFRIPLYDTPGVMNTTWVRWFQGVWDRVGGPSGSAIYDALNAAASTASSEPQMFAIKAALEQDLTGIIAQIIEQVQQQQFDPTPLLVDTVIPPADIPPPDFVQQVPTLVGPPDFVQQVPTPPNQFSEDLGLGFVMAVAKGAVGIDDVLATGDTTTRTFTTGNHTIQNDGEFDETKLIIENTFHPQKWELVDQPDYAEPYFGIKDVTGDDVRFSICTDVNTGIIKIGRRAADAPEPFLKYNNDPLQVFGTGVTLIGVTNSNLKFLSDADPQEWRLSYDPTNTRFGIYDQTATAWRLVINDVTGDVLVGTPTDITGDAFQVRGDISVTDVGTCHIRFTNDTNAQEYRWLYDAGIARFAIRDDTAGSYRLAVADSTGNVLIKTTTDNGVDALQISGTCSSTGGFAGVGTLLTALNASNISSGTLSNARLPNSGVGAGSYTYASITVDAKGIVTAASSGAAPSTTTLTAGAGISVGSFPNYTVTNTGVTSVIAGAGISVSSATGDVTITNTSPSDYRLKTAIQPLNNATDRLMNLKPVRFAFKSTPEKIQDGFIAHEVQEVVPEAVLGEKDGPEIQTLGMQMLVPLLVKSLQEANERIAALEARLEKQ